MGFSLTQNAQIAADQVNKNINLVLTIDGVDEIYGAVEILEIARIGDVTIGDFTIGGKIPVEDQSSYISMDGTSSQISQQIDIDKGRGSSISSMKVGLIDKNNDITSLITPGSVVTDLLGIKARVYLGFSDITNFPEDYITMFRGFIDDIVAESGMVKLNIVHPDQKKRSQIYTKVETELDGAINNSVTTITLASVSNILERVLGPDGTNDSSFESYVRIDNEIIQFTAISGSDLTGCTRGSLGTSAASHDDQSTVETIYRLQGDAMTLALKLMASGITDNWVEDIPVTNFQKLDDGTTVANSMFFRTLNLNEEYGVAQGDYITTTGSGNPGDNDVVLKQISQLVSTDDGDYIVVDDVTFVEEISSDATVSFRSQYDTLPDGLKMESDFIDVAEHKLLFTRFLSSFNYDFYLKDTVDNGKEFIEQEIYKPCAAFSLPRKGRSSVGFHSPPIPGDSTKIIDESVILNPSKIKLRRTVNKNFFNTIVYKFDESALEDKFLRGRIVQNATSLTRIPVGTRAFLIESKGMREVINAQANSLSGANRRLRRYEFGAEFLDGIDVQYGFGFNVEIGDILLLDSTNLKIVNTADGDRDKPPKFFEVVNKTLNFKTGKITINLVDTAFDTSATYGLISPASFVKFGIDQKTFVIEESYSSIYGVNEFKKWARYPLVAVKVRSEDGTTRYGQSIVSEFTGNQVTLRDNLGFTPQAGDLMELADHDFSDVTDIVKLLYAHMTDNATFADGNKQFQMV